MPIRHIIAIAVMRNMAVRTELSQPQMPLIGCLMMYGTRSSVCRDEYEVSRFLEVSCGCLLDIFCRESACCGFAAFFVGIAMLCNYLTFPLCGKYISKIEIFYPSI